MPKRVFNLVAALWVLQIAPTLCLGGMLTHPCFSQSEGVCTSLQCLSDDHGTPHSGSESCPHEDNCESDPCQKPVIRDGAEQTLNDACQLLSLVVFSVEREISECSICLIDLADRPDSPGLPLHDSDLPLLL